MLEPKTLVSGEYATCKSMHSNKSNDEIIMIQMIKNQNRFHMDLKSIIEIWQLAWVFKFQIQTSTKEF